MGAFDGYWIPGHGVIPRSYYRDELKGLDKELDKIEVGAKNDTLGHEQKVGDL